MERHIPHRVLLDADVMPVIETPVIDIQDLERNPVPGNRVSNSGVQVRPEVDEPLVTEEINLSGDDEKAREAIADLEKQYSKLPPG